MPPAIPLATYRLQLTADFGFEQTAAVVPYLKALGITHLYASPFMKARKKLAASKRTCRNASVHERGGRPGSTAGRPAGCRADSGVGSLLRADQDAPPNSLPAS